MAKIRTLQIYRGTTAQNDAYTGSAGELTMDTTTNELRVHDGSTAGGHVIGSGGGSSYHPDLFDVKWADHICNDVQWLRADTYSWQSGAVYQAAYQHLEDEYNALSTTSSSAFDYNDNTYVRFPAEDHLSDTHPYAYANIYSYPVNIVYADEDYISMSGSNIYNGSGSSATNLGTVTSISTLTYRMPLLETIAGVKIMYYVAQDGHKIVLSEMESAVAAIYAATGVAWYYIIDTANTRFKLPRTQFAFTGIRSGVGAFVEAGLPNITGTFNQAAWANIVATGAFGTTSNSGKCSSGNDSKPTGTFDASRCSSIYGNSDTVQPKATEMYLYFYVGNFTQAALENTAGITTEEMNNKVNIGHEVIEFQEPTAANNYTWYRKYRDGWVEQGGTISTGSDSRASVSFPIAFSLIPQVFIGRPTDSSIPSDTINKRFIGVSNVGLTGFNAWGNYGGFGSYWLAYGKSAN